MGTWLPAANFTKTSPVDGAIDQATTGVTLQWGTSADAPSYEYCYDTNPNSTCDAAWTTAGTFTSVTLEALTPGTAYEWQVRARNVAGTTDANGGTWWTFTTETLPPGTFGKSSPANGSTNQPMAVTLQWTSSVAAMSYEYCVDTSDDGACGISWVSTGGSTGATLSGLARNTTYYWQVRARNVAGTTEANGGTWWAFTTETLPPGAFAKSSPVNGATNQPTTVTLQWGTSLDATTYEYCVDTSNNATCDGTWTGASATSAGLSGLQASTTYYWQVRARNVAGTTDANGGTWWTFTTETLPPGTFAKSSPVNGGTQISITPILLWIASAGATSYEYCVDTTNDSACDGTWTSVGSAITAAVAGLQPSTTYYWQVRARNGAGLTEANGGTWWAFTTETLPPGAFAKSSPVNGGTQISITPTLTWASSAEATSYEYCVDTTNNTTCDGTWTSVLGTSAGLSTLQPSTTYYWQVRARNVAGTTEANGGTWWTFTTETLPPGTFGKSSPANGSTNQRMAVTLQWTSSVAATSYEYCYDTSNNATCDGSWTSVSGTSAGLSGLQSSTTYYWQVRARNGAGLTEANGGTWWAFSTETLPPGAFGKSSPANGATNQPMTVTLQWGASLDATSYEYCVDTSNNTTCDGTWISVPATTAGLSGLQRSTTYYWQVRGRNVAGTAEANGGTWWAFTTETLPPGAFAKSSPANGSANQRTTVTVQWGMSLDATSYEYCYDTTNNNACDGAWTSVGSATTAAVAGLQSSTTYYWQVRARNAAGITDANGATWWAFTTETLPPGAFAKSSPVNGGTQISITPTLTWTSSVEATSYEYCVDTVNDGACAGSWVSTGGSTAATLSGLAQNTTYFWQVRARNVAGTTEANGATWWTFTTETLRPGAFAKSSPVNGSANLPTTLTLQWSTSSGASTYEYCYDTTNDGACGTTWASVGSSTSTTLSSFAAGTTYYWQVRARNTGGTTDADSGESVFWSFTTSVAPPGAFAKTSPVNRSQDRATSLTISWQASAGATSYEYCYDTINDNLCDATWTTVTGTTQELTGLMSGQIYYWQVRARNAGGVAVADGDTWWSWTTTFDGDEYSDVVFQHESTGCMVVWHMQGVALKNQQWITPNCVGDPAWRIAGMADFDGDGKLDLLFQNVRTGGLVVWLMDGVTHKRQVWLTPSAVSDPNWRVSAIGDFDGDGRPDLILQNTATGGMVAWLLNGTTLKTQQWLTPGFVADPNWRIVGAGDIDGDSKPDLFFQNIASGYMVAWIMNGPTIVRQEWISPNQVDPSWRISGVADMTGDGRPDLLLENTNDGRMVVWPLRDTALIGQNWLGPGGVSDPRWYISAAK